MDIPNSCLFFLWSLQTHRIFLWNLNSHRNFFENLSSNPIFSTGAFFGAKKRQHVRDILTKIKHFHSPHLIQITSSTSHSKKTMKIPWNCGVVFLILNWSFKILFNSRKKISSQHKYYRWKWALLLPFPHYTMKHSAVCI